MELSIASPVGKEYNSNSPIPSQQLIKRTKKRGNRNRKKENSSAGPDLREDGLLHQYFISKPQKRIMYKKMLSEFEGWMVWQRKILLCGLTGKCTRSFLRTLCTVFEPVFHFGKVTPSLTKTCVYRQNELSQMVRKFEILSTETNDVSKDPSHHLNPVPQSADKLSESTTSSCDFATKPIEKPFFPAISHSSFQRTSQNFSTSSYFTGHIHEQAKPMSSTSTNSFFPKIMTSRTRQLGKICTIRTAKSGGDRPNEISYAARSFKNKKWWAALSAEQSAFCSPKGKKLMESFRCSLEIIYTWFSQWNDAEKGDCILQLLSACQLEELEYFSQCIIQRLKDRTDMDTLPDGLMIKIFGYLTNDQLLTASEVSKRWHSLSSDARLWKNKCSQLGMENGLADIISQIVAAAKGAEINWKFAYRDLLQTLNQRNSRLQELALQENNTSSCSEDEADTESGSSYVDDDARSSYEEGAIDFLDDEEDVSVRSSVSGMADYLNGDLGMIENTVQQLSAKAKLDESRDEETALDIRPEASVQARNKLSADATREAEKTAFKFVNVDGIRALKRVRKLQGHLEAVLALQFDKKRVMTGSADRTLRVWDARSGRKVHKLKGHKGGIRALRFDNELIITASWDMTIMVWNAVKFKPITTLRGHQDCVSCLETTDDILISGSHDRTLKVWSKTTWKCLKTLIGHQGIVTCLTLLEDSAVLSGSSDRTIRLWSLEGFACQRVFRGIKDVVLTVKVCGDLLAAGSNDGHLVFWNLQSGQCEADIVAHNGPLHALSFCGARFVTAGGDQLVKEWDLATCCCLRSLTGHKDVVLCVQASSRRIVSGSSDGTVRIWDMENRIRI